MEMFPQNGYGKSQRRHIAWSTRETCGKELLKHKKRRLLLGDERSTSERDRTKKDLLVLEASRKVATVQTFLWESRGDLSRSEGPTRKDEVLHKTHLAAPPFWGH